MLKTILSLSVSILSIFALGAQSDAKPELHVQIENIKSHKGQIWVAVYDNADNFLGDHTVTEVVKKVGEAHELQLTIGDLSYGHYAVSIFHDKNSNNKLDTGMFGIPKEPYGFSNNVRPKFSAPNYADAVFDFSEANQTIHIKIK